jgi:glutathione peroxidase
VILAFPTNQFGHQENSSGQEILNALKFVRPGNGFEPKAIMFDKVTLLLVEVLINAYT